MSVCVCECAYVCVCVCVCVRSLARTHARTHARMHARPHMHARTRARTHTHTHTHAHTHAHEGTHTSTHLTHETAVAASQTGGAASETAGAPSETAVAAARPQLQQQRGNRGAPRESGALKKGTLEQRKLNMLGMQQRRDINVAAINEHLGAAEPASRGRPVHVPIQSHHCTLQDEMRLVRKTVQWLSNQIGLEFVKIIEFETDEDNTDVRSYGNTRRAISAPTGEPQTRHRTTRPHLRQHGEC